MWVGPCGAWSLLACGLADPAEPASSLPASDGEGTSWEVLRAGRGGGRPLAHLTSSLPAAAASGCSSARPRSWDGCWEPRAVLPLPVIYQSPSPRRLGLAHLRPAAAPRLGCSCNLHRRQLQPPQTAARWRRAGAREQAGQGRGGRDSATRLGRPRALATAELPSCRRIFTSAGPEETMTLGFWETAP
ncbi:uncharacterized protein LOC111543590 [Piliocolobus tephrosceles]|uniref:uncharacterized protein LOC111543590 n=1 Tax=Piliocolobus tephrosceles TaxID=591936 RepID=UPI000C2A42D1|nr:uncharacterized protein LOC111543590 [Piliocolobus tephrosceles]